MQTTFIYGLECPLTKEIKYVGKSNNPKNRVRQHLYENKKGRSHNKHKHEWFDVLKEGNLKPNMVVLDEVPLSEWGYWERWWLQLLTSWGFNMTNLLEGGDGCSKHSKETLEKISKSLSGENNSFYGKKHSKESREKMSRSSTGMRHSDETKRKMSMSQTGRKHSEETKKKISKKAKIRSKGENNSRATITQKTAKKIKTMLSEGIKPKMVSEELNVSIYVVRNIRDKKSWSWLEI